VIGNAKEMSTDYIRAAYFEKYGVSIFIGIGIPIPILDEDMARAVSIRNSQIETVVVDYGRTDKPVIGKVTYDQLRSGTIYIQGKQVKTGPLSSLGKARKIAEELKRWIEEGTFLLTQPVEMLPKDSFVRGLEQRS